MHPILEYCSDIFGPLTSLGTLNSSTAYKQNLSDFWDSNLDTDTWTLLVATLEEQFNLQSLFSRRKCQDLIFLYKLVNGAIDCLDLLGAIDITIPCQFSVDIFNQQTTPQTMDSRGC